MAITPEDMVRARDEATRAIAGLSEDERWALLRQWLEERNAHGQEALRLLLRLEQLGFVLAPKASSKAWKKFLNDDRAPIERRLHELRLSAAIAEPPSPEELDDPAGPFNRR